MSSVPLRVVVVEPVELRAVASRVEDAEADQELDPLVRGVAAEQRVVEVEQRDALACAAALPFSRTHALANPYSAAASSSHSQK